MSEQKLLYIKFKSGQSRTYSVVGRLSDFGISVFQHDITTKNGLSDEFQDNKGYIDENGDIWIYRKNLPSMSGIASMPIPWFNMYDEIVGDEIRTTITWNKRCHAKTKALFCEKNTSSMDVSSIAEITDPNVPLYNKEMLDDMNAGGEKYIPVIDEKNDDFLKLLIKNIIIDKGTNLNAIKHVVDKAYQMSNLKAALNNKTKISTSTFNTWAELLGFDFEINIIDRSNGMTEPLKHKISYTSVNNKVNLTEIDEKKEK